VVASDGRIDAAAILADLAARGVGRVVCEGGPTLNHLLLAGGVVDELFLTLAPRLAGGRDPLTLVAGPALAPGPRLDLRSLYERAGELFLRYDVLDGALR
jgi:riboflavin biosynthesis pyrimidine reductase